VLKELAKQVPDQDSASPLAGSIKVYVRSSGAQNHPVFNDARREFKADERFHFDNNAGRGRRALLSMDSLQRATTRVNHSLLPLRDRFDVNRTETWVESWVASQAATVGEDQSSAYAALPANRRRLLVDGATGPVRAQTRDVVGLLRATEALGYRYKYFLFQEDDFLPCRNMLLGVHHLSERAHEVLPQWRALRAGFGLNGIVVKSEDVSSVARHLKKGEARRPPDHLFFEWADHAVVAYRHNLWYHLGKQSVRGPFQIFLLCYYMTIGCPSSFLFFSFIFSCLYCQIGGR